MAQKHPSPAELALKIISQGPAVMHIAEMSGKYATTFITSNIEKQFGYTPDELMATPGFWVSHVYQSFIKVHRVRAS